MSDDSLFALVEKMRAAQRRWVRARDNLKDVRALEDEVDDALAERCRACAGPPEEGKCHERD